MNFMGRLQSNAPVSAAPMARNLSNFVPGAGVPTHEDHGFRIRHAPHRAPPLRTGSN
jgi:hypothetical protein